jgi:hypothetical protein
MRNRVTAGSPRETDQVAISRILDDLERYAGWLADRTTSKRVRRDLKGLRELMSADRASLLDAVQALILDISELSNSATRDLLHKRARVLGALASGDEPM